MLAIPLGLPAGGGSSSTRRFVMSISRPEAGRRKSPWRRGSIGYGRLTELEARGAAAAIFGSGRGRGNTLRSVLLVSITTF